jgi:hypothetical protein
LYLGTDHNVVMTEVEFNGYWHPADFDKDVHAGKRFRFCEDGSTTVIRQRDLELRVRPADAVNLVGVKRGGQTKEAEKKAAPTEVKREKKKKKRTREEEKEAPAKAKSARARADDEDHDHDHDHGEKSEGGGSGHASSSSVVHSGGAASVGGPSVVRVLTEDEHHEAFARLDTYNRYPMVFEAALAPSALLEASAAAESASATEAAAAAAAVETAVEVETAAVEAAEAVAVEAAAAAAPVATTLKSQRQEEQKQQQQQQQQPPHQSPPSSPLCAPTVHAYVMGVGYSHSWCYWLCRAVNLLAFVPGCAML